MAELNNIPATGEVDELLQNYQNTGEAVVNDGSDLNFDFNDEPSQATKPKRKRLEYNPEEFNPQGLRRAGKYVGEDLTEEAIMSGFGNSRYDKDFFSGMDVEQQRALEQSSTNKILSGLGKMAVTAGSVFADTILGTATGAFTFGGQAVNQIFNKNEQNGFYCLCEFIK